MLKSEKAPRARLTRYRLKAHAESKQEPQLHLNISDKTKKALKKPLTQLWTEIETERKKIYGNKIPFSPYDKPFEPVSMCIWPGSETRADEPTIFEVTKENLSKIQILNKCSFSTPYSISVVLNLEYTDTEITNAVSDLLSKIRPLTSTPDALMVREMACFYEVARELWVSGKDGFINSAKSNQTPLKNFCKKLRIAPTKQAGKELLAEEFNISLDTLEKNWWPKIKKYCEELENRRQEFKKFCAKHKLPLP